jgi:hypothetical protein
MESKGVLNVALVTSSIAVNEKDPIPVVEVDIIHIVTRVEPVQVHYRFPGVLNSLGSRSKVSLAPVEAVVGHAILVEAVAPATPIEMHDSLFHAITPTLRVVKTSRSTIETDSSSVSDVVEMTLEATLFLSRWVNYVYGVSRAGRDSTSVHASSNLGESINTPGGTPRVLD